MSKRESTMTNLGFAAGGLVFIVVTSDLTMRTWWHFLLWFLGFILSAALFGLACAVFAHFTDW